MAVTLGSLCEKAGYLYGMRVIAGKEGMTNIVQWDMPYVQIICMQE